MTETTKIEINEAKTGTKFFKNPFQYLSKSLKDKSNEHAMYVLIFFAINGIFLVFNSHVNVDENFYTYCAKLLWDGFVPYVDFFFTQSPLLLYIYGFMLRIFGNNLLNSRLITFTLTFITAILIIKLGKNLKFEHAGIYAVLGLSIAWWILYNLTITKTYALTTFFIVLSLYIYTTNLKNSWKYGLSIIFMAMAGGVRLNMAVLPIFLGCWIAVKEWDRDSKFNLLKNLIKYLLIAAITLILIYGPIFLIDLLENGSLNKSFYNLFGVHANRNLMVNMNFLGILGSLNLLIDGLLRYGAITILIIFLPIYFFFVAIIKKDYKALIKKYELIFLIFLVQLAIFGAYAMLPTLFHEYIVTALPITLLLVFIGLSKFFSYNRLHHPTIKLFQKNYQKYFVVAVVLIIPLTQIAEINQYVIPRMYQNPSERLIYNDLSQYQEISNLIGIVTPPWGCIMAYDPALATQSGRNLLPGQEMAYFSYHHWYEPFGLNSFACIYYHVINGQILYYQLLSNYTTMAVFTLDEAIFTFMSEQSNFPLFYGNQIMEVLRTNYTLYIYPWGFGQLNDILFIYLRNNISNWIF